MTQNIQQNVHDINTYKPIQNKVTAITTNKKNKTKK